MADKRQAACCGAPVRAREPARFLADTIVRRGGGIRACSFMPPSHQEIRKVDKNYQSTPVNQKL